MTGKPASTSLRKLLTTFRYRWMEHSGRYVIERRHERLVLRIWPIYEWEAVHHVATPAEAVEWIFAQRVAP